MKCLEYYSRKDKAKHRLWSKRFFTFNLLSENAASLKARIPHQDSCNHGRGWQCRPDDCNSGDTRRRWGSDLGDNLG